MTGHLSRVKTPFLPLVIFGLISFMLGSSVYLFDRPAGSWGVADLSLANIRALDIFGALGYNLPSFFHALAFSLLTVAAGRYSLKQARVVCLGWLVIHFIFELGQNSIMSGKLASIIRQIGDYQFSERSALYFERGVFDPLDIIASIMGVSLAYGLIYFYSYRQANKTGFAHNR